MSGTLFIAGMHRSGTSLTANWLHDNGLFIGDDLLSGFSDNKYGHFEDMEFLSIMVNELASRNLYIDGLILKGQINFSTFSKVTDTKLASLIARRNKEHEVWGWKEPRSTLFLDALKTLVPQLKVLAVFRKPELVVQSLYKRLKRNKWYKTRNPVKKLRWYMDIDLNPEKWVAIFSEAYCTYNKAILDFCDKYPDDIIIVDIDQLPARADRVMKWICSETGFRSAHYDLLKVLDEKIITRDSSILVSPEATTVFKELQAAARIYEM